MNNFKRYKWLILIWIIYILLSYYVLPYFLIPFFWFVFVITLLILGIRNIVKTFKLINELKQFKIRVFKTILVFFLFGITFYKVNYFPNLIVEKIDWHLLYEKRNQIVYQVKNKELEPNVAWNDWICELPFDFPIISNGGNDVGITKNEDKPTIHFWVFRNFFDNPSTYFIYTENEDDLKYFEKKIKENPKNNWKLKDNWYRIYDD